MTSIKSLLSHLSFADRISYEYQTAIGASTQSFTGASQTSPVIETAMKRKPLKPSNFAYLQKTKLGILLQQEEILKAFSVLTTALLIAYVIIFKALNLFHAGYLSTLAIYSPLVTSIVLVIAVYSKKCFTAIIMITWVLPLLMIFASWCDPAINYAKVIIIYMLVVLFINNSRKQRLIGFIWLTMAYAWIQFRYYQLEAEGNSAHLIPLEMTMMPIFCLVTFVILARIKKEFTIYQQAIRQQKEVLEKKNITLENLVSLSEQQRSKLKRTVLLKEKLISIISHDVRVPMNSFKFLIDNFEKGYISEKTMLDGIIETKKDLVKMDAMVLDLVDWARSGKDAVDEKPITFRQMQEIMESVLSIYKLCLKNKNLKIVPVIDMPEDRCLTMTKRELAIVMRNLVSNAIKFSQPGKSIIMSLKAEANGSDSVATMTVKDFGTGMHPSVLERLNGNKVISTIGTLNEVGLGIGLSIVFDVIHERNLSYDIKSAKNKGTEFSINIPMISGQ